ncbi:Protein of unknown function [Actinobaculum suis]|uniref:DUF4244 domain-containing protein n=1 Tax=Actinobaculum suis TaxID=1657 RepID=A0A0K9EVK8_9ACTO|nr:DUF4244 domain-containing protein [Actinobaculum suis]KMY23926.1 hypothetical protein ACU19_01295 [Actinobaculum suis]MDY5152467.1 DUF4244 domain-containing protein [Actinobaculum suis]OCA94776.1 DUF4244 domain-containing protein [Actinobaculum suis]OCA95423.1 DUF4244 domain-containing protein [Actinobaculum suis]SDE41875.1 Protein of unknown function [Actinobaculum suis]
MSTHYADIRHNPGEEGMTTAEYAVGTVGATSIAGILVWLAQQDWFKDMISALFKKIFRL